MRVAAVALLPLALAAARDDPFAGRVAGPPRECIDLDFVGGPDIVDGRTILYRQNRHRIWRTGPTGHCSTMRPGDGLIVELYGRQLCRNDRFRVRSTGTLLGGVCRFDAFTPYDEVGGSR